MRRFLFETAIISGLILTGLPAMAQDHDRDRDHDRDDRGYSRDSRDQGYWRNHLFERVREDLDRVQSTTPVFSGDQFRLARTKQELNELQRDAMDGRFDNRRVDDVINALERVVGDNRMPRRDRDILSDDLAQLRRFREHHENYYPRG